MQIKKSPRSRLEIKRVKAHIRSLSIEPLLARIDPAKLDLEGIHWVIVGGTASLRPATVA